MKLNLNEEKTDYLIERIRKSIEDTYTGCECFDLPKEFNNRIKQELENLDKNFVLKKKSEKRIILHLKI